MTPEGRKLEEEQIKNSFSELQKKLEELKNEVNTESDDSKKQGKNEEIKRLEKDASEMKALIDALSSLQEQDLEALKTRLESLKNAIQNFKGEVVDLQNKRTETPTTCDLLKGSETYNRLLNIISSNPNKFQNIKDKNGNNLTSPEAKLERIFEKIRENMVLFLKNKLGSSERTEKIINNTIAPAFERSLMEMLKKQRNKTNGDMFERISKISFRNLKIFRDGVKGFADNFGSSYDQFNQWVNAIDYLSVHNGILKSPEKSAVLTNPIEFKNYLNDPIFSPKDDKDNSISFSPYKLIDKNIFKIDENQTFEFGMSLPEKKQILQEIGNIQVVNNPNTTSLIVKMLNKSDLFFKKVPGLQKTANSLLDGISSLNSVTKIFGVDILGEIANPPEKRDILFKILDFVCKLIGIIGGLEGIVKKWRLDRMNLTDVKNENISQIFKKYKELAGDNVSLSITDETSCKTALNDFKVTDPQKASTTKGDFLRDSIAEKMDVSLISPAVVEQAVEQHKLGNSLDYYLKKKIIHNNGKTREIFVVDESKFTDGDKLELAHNHLNIMKAHLEKYRENDLEIFYKSINSTEDLALCITASLYVNKDDVIEGIKAKVFLPENYGVIRSDGTVVESNDNSGKENLDSTESSEKSAVSEQWMYDKILEYGITDKRQIAYILATVKGETNPNGVGFRNIEEIGKGKGKEYGKVDSETGKAYYGRGFVQLTWKKNYQKYTEIIRNRGTDFKDNDGNIIKCNDIDLVKDPDFILKSNDLAAFILVHGMKNGIFTGKKLDDFINSTKTDYIAARGVVNGSDKANQFANTAQSYLNKIDSMGVATA